MPNHEDERGNRLSKQGDTISCPTCGLRVSGGITKCPQDGTRLIAEPAGTFAQQYEFLEALGTGGMSVIYKARHRALNKLVAIKMLHEHMIDELHVRRFQQEGKAASTLDHPNIIKVFDFGLTDQGQPYMVMDVADGKSLGQVLEELNVLPLSQCLIIFIDVCDALIHAHSKGILHRDLKPSNIMLTTAFDRPMQAKLVDFGIAKIMSREDNATIQQLTQAGDLFGSPLYMSPEQCQGKHLDARSDMYSFGCMMFEALVGHVPIQGDTMVETLSKQVITRAPLLREARSDKAYPRRLEDVVDRCLSKNPENRYRNMEEVKAALVAIQTELDAGALKDKYSLRAFLRVADQWRLPVILMVAVICLISVVLFADFKLSRHKAQLAEMKVNKQHDQAIGQSQVFPMNHHQIKNDLIIQRLGAGFPKEELNLNNTKVTDEALPYINLHPDLQVLYMDETKITDAGLLRLSDMHDLRRLSIKGTKITNAGLKVLGNMPKLTFLGLDYCDVNENGMQYVTNLSNLQNLSLMHCPLKGSVVKSLQTMPVLQELNLSSIPLRSEDLPELQHFPHLTKLTIRKCELNDKAIKYLPPTIETLIIPGNKNITDASMPFILQLPHLKTLDISYTKISPRGLRQLADCPELEELKLNGNHVTAETVEALKELKHLNAVQFAYCNDINDQMVAEIAKLQNITSLSLSNNYVLTAETASILASNMPQLKKLFIENTNIISENSVKELAKLKLKELHCKGCDVDGPDYAEIQFLRKHLKGCEVKAS